MTAEVRRDIAELLADELDSIQPTLDVMSHPYRRAAEMTRRVEIATTIVTDWGCDCTPSVQCLGCRLLPVLEGDQ